jgi:hypothetical protein
LGLFSASAVFSKKIVIVLFYPVLQEYYLLSVAGQYIKSGNCQYVYPGAFPDDTDTPG